MKVYIVLLNWYYDEDSGYDINVYDSYEKAHDVFLESIEDERGNTWISDCLTEDGHIDTDMCEFETNLDLKDKQQTSKYWIVSDKYSHRRDELQLLIFEVN